MPKKKVLMVVGAGASLDFGMPSVTQIGDIIREAAREEFSLAAQPNMNLYGHIEEMVTLYWNNHVFPPPLRRPPHFEDALYTIFAVAAAYPLGAYTSPLGALVTASKLPPLRHPAHVHQSPENQLHALGCAAVDALISHFRTRCRMAETERVAEFAQLQSFMSSLTNQFDIAVVTLNYDNILHRTLNGIETGFNPTSGRFEERRILVSEQLALHASSTRVGAF